MILWIAHDRDAAAVRAHRVALRDRLDRVVGALAVHIRMQQLEKRCHRWLIENDHVVHVTECRNQLGPIGGIQNGAVRAFEGRDRPIAVDPNDESIGLLRGRLEIPNMSDVQKIEAAVGEGVREAVRPILRDAFGERLAGEDFAHDPAGLKSRPPFFGGESRLRSVGRKPRPPFGDVGFHSPTELIG